MPIAVLILGIILVLCFGFGLWETFSESTTTVAVKKTISSERRKTAKKTVAAPIQDTASKTDAELDSENKPEHKVLPIMKYAGDAMYALLFVGIAYVLVRLLRGTAFSRAIAQKFMSIATGDKAFKFFIAMVGLAVLNISAILSMQSVQKHWHLSANPFWTLYNNDSETLILTNLVIVVAIFFNIVGTKQGKHFNYGLWLFVTIPWLLIAPKILAAIEENVFGYSSASTANVSTFPSSFTNQGDLETAKNLVKAKFGDLTPDCRYARDKYFSDDPSMWAVCMSEGKSQLDKDGNVTLSSAPGTENIPKDKRARGVFQHLLSTFCDIGMRKFHASSCDEWKTMAAKPELNYDIDTLDGNSHFAKYLKDTRGLADWNRSKAGWEDIASAQYGATWTNAQTEGQLYFHGSTVSIIAKDVRVADLDAPVSRDNPTWYPLTGLYPKGYHMCAFVVPVEGVMAIVDHGENAVPRYSDPIPLTEPMGNAVRVSFFSTNKDKKVIFRYQPMQDDPSHPNLQTCAKEISQ